MVRIAGIDLPNKRVEIALTYLYGIGRSRAKKILKEVDIDVNLRMNDLSESQSNALRQFLDANKQLYIVEGDLRQKNVLAIRRLAQIGSYRGIRHNRKLPVRGQRSKTNARTRKGKGKAIANKKQVGK